MTTDMTTTFTIDCQTCPARGRLCGDCFVPVLGRSWLQPPAVTPRDSREARTGPPAAQEPHEKDGRGPEALLGTPGALPRAPLDTDELAAVSAFVRAGLVSPDEAASAHAELTAGARSAAG